MAEIDDHDVREAMYDMWRQTMWLKGYGSYTEIDEAVVRGELMPGQDYPSKRAQSEEGTQK